MTRFDRLRWAVEDWWVNLPITTRGQVHAAEAISQLLDAGFAVEAALAKARDCLPWQRGAGMLGRVARGIEEGQHPADCVGAWPLQPEFARAFREAESRADLARRLSGFAHALQRGAAIDLAEKLGRGPRVRAFLGQLSRRVALEGLTLRSLAEAARGFQGDARLERVVAASAACLAEGRSLGLARAGWQPVFDPLFAACMLRADTRQRASRVLARLAGGRRDGVAAADAHA